MKNIFKLMPLLLAVVIGTGTLTSCSDDDESTMSRLFRPVISEDNITSGLDADTIPYIKLKWDNYTTANQYVITMTSVDGTETYTQTVDTAVVTFNNLGFDKEYNVAIHAENTNNGLTSKDYTLSVTTADFPTELNSLGTSDIIDTQAKVTWNTNDGKTIYDSLKVYSQSNDSLIGSYHVSATELANGSKILRNLKAKSSYRVEAYKGTAYKGKKNFKTVAAENFSGTVVDLRGLDPDASYNFLSQESYDSIAALYPNQDITIVLQGGVTYQMPNISLDNTTGKIKFITGLSLSGNAEFDVTNNLDVASGASVGGLTFEKINFTGAKPSDTDSNMGGKYIINMSGSGSSLGLFKITNCNVKWKRGICRIKTSAAIDSFVIDNCIVDSIGGYGIFNCDNSKAQIKDAVITNSTFSNCNVTFANTKGLAMNSVDIENCTFCYCNTEGKNFLDFKGRTITNGITLKNCLFGISGATSTNIDGTGLQGYSGISPTATDCYFTSDVTWQPTSDTDATPVSQIAGTTLKTSTTDTFKSPTTGNFTITTSEIKNVGDARWY